MSAIRLATFNLYHFAVPGIYWHERRQDRTYSDAQWMLKRQWIVDTLAAIDADIVSFQEVVSVAALRRLLAEAGYDHFSCLTEPRFHKDDPEVYANATVAIASRLPIAAEREVKTFDTIIDETLLDRDAMYSRRPLRCVINAPQIGDLIVYAAHFKSQGAFFNDDIIDAIEGWPEKFEQFYLERLYAGIDQVSRRAAEAGALYLQVRDDLQADREQPIAILGDLNEGPQSHTLSILTQADRIFEVGSVPWSQIPAEHRFRRYIHRLYDAYHLSPNADLERPVTYHADRRSSVLDYAVVSNGLHPDNPRRRAVVVEHRVHDAHFDDNAPRELTSDHAPVTITVEPAGGGAPLPVIGL